jgi:hypothetical protein
MEARNSAQNPVPPEKLGSGRFWKFNAVDKRSTKNAPNRLVTGFLRPAGLAESPGAAKRARPK